MTSGVKGGGHRIPRRMPKILSSTLYCYVERPNAKHARTKGKELFGSFSAYVNALIAKDRGVKPRLGFWKAEGEAKKLGERPTRGSRKSESRGGKSQTPRKSSTPSSETSLTEPSHAAPEEFIAVDPIYGGA